MRLKSIFPPTMLLLALLCLFCCTSFAAHKDVLFVWGGGPGGDFLLTIDFDPTSETYGELLHTTPIPESTTTQDRDNEPRHHAISFDNTWIVAGGYSSHRNNKDNLFVFKIENTTTISTSFAYSVKMPAGCIDAVTPISNEEFVISATCKYDGSSPGTLLHFNVRTRAVRRWAKDEVIDGFNPNGCSWRNDLGLVCGDFLNPESLFFSPPVLQFRDTARFFNTDGSLNKTLTLVGAQGEGIVDIVWLPKDTKKRAITSSTTTNNLYLVDPVAGTNRVIFDLTTLTRGVNSLSAGILPLSDDGKYLIVPFSMRYVALFDVSNPDVPKALDNFDFCLPPPDSGLDLALECEESNNNVGTHSALFFKDRVVVVNSLFILGNVNYAGTRTIHTFKVENNQLVFDTDFALSVREIMDLPHGIVAATLEYTPEPTPPAPSAAATLFSSSILLVTLLVSVLFH